MNLHPTFHDAYNQGFSRYVRGKKEIKLYLLPCKVGRREFYTIMSETEAKKYKISLAKADFIFGESEKHSQIRDDVQGRINDPIMKKRDTQIKYIKACHRMMKAEEALKNFEK